MLHVPMAISCFPRKWKILARRFRMEGWSLAISMACVREEGWEHIVCLLVCQNRLKGASPPRLWTQPCYNKTLVPHVHLPGSQPYHGTQHFGYSSLAFNSRELDLLPCSRVMSSASLQTPGKPLSLRYIHRACSPIFLGQAGGGA